MQSWLTGPLVGLLLAATGPVECQTLDREMPALAGKLSQSLAGQGFKHVAAIDFTDLQGQPTELGRFLSELLAVEIVSNGGVSMVDRANIKSILAEHRLTEQGLVNPANAKKLGEFAGVDAILIGNVTALDDGVVLMVKAIATNSADIVAAGRIRFARTSEIQQLLNRSIVGGVGALDSSAPNAGARGAPGYQQASAIATKDLGPLRVILKTVLPLKLRAENGQPLNGMRCSFEFTNLDTHRRLVVAAIADPGRQPGLYAIGGGTTDGTAAGDLLRTTLVDERGTVWKLYAVGVSNVTGLGVVSPGRNANHQPYSTNDIPGLLVRREETGANTAKDDWDRDYTFVWGSTTPIAPGEVANVVMNFREESGGSSPVAAPASFQFSGELLVGVASGGRATSFAVHNLAFDRVILPGTS